MQLPKPTLEQTTKNSEETARLESSYSYLCKASSKTLGQSSILVSARIRTKTTQKSKRNELSLSQSELIKRDTRDVRYQ